MEGVYSAEEMAAWKRGINENLAKVCLSAGTRIAQCVCPCSKPLRDIGTVARCACTRQ